MTIQDYGSIGEIVGAIATVATLLYLAVQIRTNTRAVRASTHHSNSQGWSELDAVLGLGDPTRRVAHLALRRRRGGSGLVDALTSLAPQSRHTVGPMSRLKRAAVTFVLLGSTAHASEDSAISSYHDYRKPVEVNQLYRHRANRGRLISWKLLRSMSTQQIYNDVLAMPFLSTYQTFDTSRLAKYTDKEKTRAAIEYPINVYSVVYETVDPFGNVTAASGAVLVPQGVDRPVPLYGLQRGTIYYDLDAPSYGEMTTWGIWRALVPTSAGYVVAMADYLGFGASRHMLHPYPMSRPNAVAVVDLLRATKTLAQKLGVFLNDQLFLQGMSEGGQATLATQREVEAHHAREFNLVACAPGAASANVSGLMKTVLGSDKIIAPQIFSLALMSYNETYRMNRPLSDFFKQPYAELLPELHDLEHGNDYIVNRLPKDKTTDLYDDDFLRSFRGDGEEDLKQAFRQNDVHLGWTPRTQMRIYHGTGDEIIPFSDAETMYDNFKAMGADVELVAIEGAPHIDSMLPITLLSVEWFNELRLEE